MRLTCGSVSRSTIGRRTTSFKYLHDEGVAYCRYYNARLYAGIGMRVATPIHAEEAKRFNALRRTDPVLFEQIVDLFPTMLLQDRYSKDIERPTAQSMEEVREYLDAHPAADVHEQELINRRFAQAQRAHQYDPLAYNPHHVLRYFQSGAHKRKLLPDTSTAAKLRAGGGAA